MAMQPTCSLQAGSRRVVVPTSRPKVKPTHVVRFQTLNGSETGRKRPEYVANRISDPNYVRVLDTTLRDGEQSPGATLTAREKLEIARQLSQLGVDVIEAGFPVSSPADFEAVKQIAIEVGNEVQEDGYVPVICGMGRTVFKDLERTWEAVRHAQRPRVHMVLATSEIHMQHKLHMTRDQVIENAVAACKHLQSMGCYDIEFCAEDASRSDPAFLYEVLGAVIAAGATTLNIPDTVGWSMPHEYSALIAGIKANTKGVDGVVLSTHCHDDLGLATANSLAGVLAGARQIECCVNGIGERAGNASLEQVVMAMALRGEETMGGLWNGIRPVHIYPASRMVSSYSGMIVQPHMAIVGANAFSHESGMHQDGILKHRETYQIMTPESVGLPKDTSIVLGKLSGRKAVSSRLEQLGFGLSAEEVNDVFKRFKALADKKKNVTDDDLMDLVTLDHEECQGLEQEECLGHGQWELGYIQVVHGTMNVPTSAVTLKGPDGVTSVAQGVGTGPVDATFKAIDSLVKLEAQLVDYSAQSLWDGSQAPVTARVAIQPTGAMGELAKQLRGGGSVEAKPLQFSGQDLDEDIVVCSARAYLTALNKMIGWVNAVNRKRGAASSSSAGSAGKEEQQQQDKAHMAVR
ncbi:hypothetical protein OEZ86_009166 [Tetradesmus obliquus]|nr:hypothetical protein OEZ86_009166 [Tetradesmus obliquus]